MTHTSPPGARPSGQHAPVRCAVSAGSSDTDYVRAGRGEPPVVLLAAAAPPGGEPELVAPLAEHFRVVAPCAVATQAAASDGRFVVWLRDFLDGIGLDAVAVVAEPGLTDAALRFAASDPSRVACVVLLGASAPEATGFPLLTHAPDAGAAATAAAIAPFIAAHA